MSAPAAVLDFLTGAGVFAAGSALTSEPLHGGVSSDIWVVSDGAVRAVVKTPLEQLKVESDWHAPVDRSESEVAWLQVAGELVPGVCPAVLAYDQSQHLLALAYLDPDAHRLWKSELLEGRVDPGFAALVGDRLGTIHRLTAGLPQLAERFDTDDLFRALRIEPYFEHLLTAHPDLEPAVRSTIADMLAHKRALVHGDASPKNILVGPDGPVILDAEAAWWGDPAFDVAFCLNHLLLKALLPVNSVDKLADAAHALFAAYCRQVDWEHPAEVEFRTARLLPVLMLARVDGRSPVEYLDAEQASVVREFARRLLLDPVDDLLALTTAWKAELT